MKRKPFLRCVLACTLVANVLVSQAGAVYYKDYTWADDKPFGLFAFSDAIKWTAKDPIFGDLTSQEVRPGYLVDYNGDKAIYSSFDTLYTAFASPESDSLLSTLKHYESLEDEGTAVLTKQSHLAMMIGANPSGGITLEDQLVVSGRKAQLGIDNVNEEITLNLQSGIKVTDSGTLVIMNDQTAQDLRNMNLEIVLGDSIVVEGGGSLLLQSVDTLYSVNEGVGGMPTARNTIVAPKGKPAIVVDGGTVNVSHQTFERADSDTSDEALIQVKSGEVSFEPSAPQSSETGLPEFSNGHSALVSEYFNFELDNGDSTAPAISVGKDASVTLKTGDFTASGDGAIFELAEGATLTLEGGKIENTSENPAITVAEGATVELPEDSKVQVTTSNKNGQAITLAEGAKVEVADTTVTVGTDGDNYVGNNGVVFLDAGATAGKDNKLNHAVVLPDGSIVEGTKDEQPTVDEDKEGNITVNVPAGGQVTDANGEITPMPGGGSVSNDGDQTTVKPAKVPVTGVTLDKTSLSLTVGGEATLTATVAPENATNKTVTWASSDEAVATVENGKVTAMAVGTATITVTTEDGGKTASCTVTVYRDSSGGDSSSDDSDPTYNVALPGKVTGGGIKVSPRNAEKGETVTITVTPDDGYELDELTVTDRKGNELDLTEKAGGKFTFKMPASRVEIEVSFKLIETEPEAPAFADVPADAYYADAVAWAVKEGITSGTDTNTFSPNASCTRAQMVTFLWRANGSPKATGANPFTDVSADAYYYDAVLWAAEKGVTSGTTATTFSPDAVLTRGQTVTFLWRSNGSPAVSGNSFGDVADEAYYADAVAWAVKEGITSGTGGNSFSPDAPCTRAQIVTFLYRDAQ